MPKRTDWRSRSTEHTSPGSLGAQKEPWHSGGHTVALLQSQAHRSTMCHSVTMPVRRLRTVRHRCATRTAGLFLGPGTTCRDMFSVRVTGMAPSIRTRKSGHRAGNSMKSASDGSPNHEGPRRNQRVRCRLPRSLNACFRCRRRRERVGSRTRACMGTKHPRRTTMHFMLQCRRIVSFSSSWRLRRRTPEMTWGRSNGSCPAVTLSARS